MCDTIGNAPETSGSVLEADVVPTHYSGPGQWLGPSAAAQRLGCSERTLWRKVEAGLFARRTLAGRAQVYVPTPDMIGAPPETSDTPEIAAGALRRPEEPLAALILHELSERRADDRLVLEAAEARVARLEAAVARERARILELERANARLEERLTPWPVIVRRWLGLDV